VSAAISILMFLISTGLIITGLLWLVRTKVSMSVWVRLLVMLVLSVLVAWLGLFALAWSVIIGPMGLSEANLWDTATGIMLFAILFDWVWYRTDLLRRIADNGTQSKKAAASEGG